MAQATSGDTVKVHYEGTLEDGTLFDSSSGGEPLEFTLGAGEVIPGFEGAVLGMTAGETKTVTIPPEEAYGPWEEDKLVVLERSQLPADLEPEVGMVLEAVSEEDGMIAQVTIRDVSGDRITLDANHDLAGKALTFEITLVEITGA